MNKKQNTYNWDLTKLYKNIEDPLIEEDVKKSEELVNSFEKKWQKDSTYTKDLNKLVTALKEYENIFETYGILNKPMYYIGLKLALEQDNKELKAKENILSDKETELINKIQFFELRLGKISKNVQNKILKDERFSRYKHFLEKIFLTSKYNLSDKEEKIINILSKSGTSNWVDMIEEFLSKETGKINGKVLTFNQLISKNYEKDKKIRDEANKQINKILKKWVDVSEHEINSFLEVNKNIRKMKKFEGVDAPRHISSDVDSEVIHAMKKSVEDNFKLVHKFYELYCKLLNVKTIGYNERAVEYGENITTYEIEDAFKLVKKTFKNLDTKFSEIIETAISNGLIDVYPKKGKSGGAFCTHGSKALPIYVLSNFDNKLNDVLTLAHELGHYINHHLSNLSNSPLQNIGSLATAEVSSTFFENFVLEEILKNSNDELKFTILIKKLQDDVSTIFRQIACYNFEYELHTLIESKGYLSKTEIGALFSKHMKSYLGSNVRMDKGHENWWVYWSHIRSPFYVYSYASGLLISKSLQNMVKSDKRNIEKIIKFLSMGGSRSPKDIFQDMGIDITNSNFWNLGLNRFKDDLELAISLAMKLGKI